MAKIHCPFVSASPTSDLTKERVCDATESLLKAITILDDLAKPKQFNLSSAQLLQFDRIPSNGSRHHVRVEGEKPIDEIVGWQIYGHIGDSDRIINCKVYHIFHTQEDNRSGSGEFFINGKTDCKPEYGGITLDDIWQDANKWEYTLPWIKDKGFIAEAPGCQ